MLIPVFDHTQPNVVVLGDSNTFAFGPPFLDALAQRGWDPDQLVLSYRSGSKARHWLPRGHALHRDKFGKLIERKGQRGKVSVLDALSPLTRLVIIGLGGNNLIGTKDDHANSVFAEYVIRLAPFARIVWRGPPPSTATRGGKVASARLRRGRYRKNGLIKQDLKRLGFQMLGEELEPEQRRVYLDVLALHATGPAPRVQPLATGREVDLKAERVVVLSLFNDHAGKRERATRGPWESFVRARDGLESHVPKGPARDFVEIVAERGLLDLGPAPALPESLRMRVIDPVARLRGGAPRFRARGEELLEQGSAVQLERWEGRYGLVRDPDSGEELGWTLRSNLEFEP